MPNVQNIFWFKDPTCTIYRPEKTSEKGPKVKTYLLKYVAIRKRLVQFKDQKKLKAYLIELNFS